MAGNDLQSRQSILVLLASTYRASKTIEALTPATNKCHRGEWIFSPCQGLLAAATHAHQHDVAPGQADNPGNATDVLHCLPFDG